MAASPAAVADEGQDTMRREQEEAGCVWCVNAVFVAVKGKGLINRLIDVRQRYARFIDWINPPTDLERTQAAGTSLDQKSGQSRERSRQPPRPQEG